MAAAGFGSPRRGLEMNFGRWSFEIIDMDRCLVYFKDESYGDITSWLWNFDDGATSTERNPVHEFEEPGIYYVVYLDVEDPAGKARTAK